jgi:hypothetical protein
MSDSSGEHGESIDSFSNFYTDSDLSGDISGNGSDLRKKKLPRLREGMMDNLDSYLDSI